MQIINNVVVLNVPLSSVTFHFYCINYKCILQCTVSLNEHFIAKLTIFCFPFFSAHDNDVKEANKSKSSPSSSQSLQAHVPPSPIAPSLQRQPTASSQQLLLQASSYPQHSPALSQLHMLADCQALGPVGSREYLQPHQASLLSASMPASSFASFPSLASGLRGLPLQGPISMQVSMGPERHCLGLTYGSGYLSSHHTFTAGCFDR